MSIAKNKKAYFDYEILEKFEAGIVLQGFEVKSVKLGHISLKGAYVTIKDEEAYLINTHISPYQPSNMRIEYDPTRSRKLLLKKSEIVSLMGKAKSQGLTILPLSVYNKKGKIKIELGLGRGKKKYEKREKIKRKDTEREVGRTLKK